MHSGLAMAVWLAAAGFAFAQTADLTIQSFDSDDSSGNRWGSEWGPGFQFFDADNGNPPGSLQVGATFSNSSDTPNTTFVCLNGNPWYVGTAINFSEYKALEFDIKWDNTSDITIDQFNNLSTIPLTQTNSSGQVVLNALLNSGSINGLDINVCGGAGGQMGTLLTNLTIPTTAASGWVHVVVPIDPNLANLDGASGIVFHKWVSQYSGQIAADFQGRFWIDNVALQGTAAPPPPPTVQAPKKATKGLNIFTSTSGLYDRQSAVLRQSSGLSWIGMASEANPVTYSFTIVGYPNSINCEAWMFLVPNPQFLDNAPDWNETNCVKVRIQGNATNAVLQFQYKVNEDHQQAMYSGGNETRTSATETNNYYYSAAPGSLPGGPVTEMVSPGVYNITNESGFLGSVTNNGILGKWTIKFTSDTDVTLIAPNGQTTSCVLPAYNAALFAEQASPGAYVYLGMQANNADALNQAIVYSDFAISNTATPFYENFLTDSVLDTTNVWDTSAGSGPNGVLIVPSNAVSWVSWSLPANGFGLEIAPTLDNPLGWTSPSGRIISMAGMRSQLVFSNDIPAGNAAFFRLVKRGFTKLQVLLPGEEPAPNTPTGKTGTPTATAPGDFVSVTVRAVDSNWNLVASVIDIVHIESSDASDVTALDAGLSNGTGEFFIQIGNAGDRTFTATDVADDTKTPGVSSTLTVGAP